jgi:hypothetical protein
LRGTFFVRSVSTASVAKQSCAASPVPRLGGVEHGQLLEEGVQVDELLLQEEQVRHGGLREQHDAVHHHVGAGLAVGRSPW